MIPFFLGKEKRWHDSFFLGEEKRWHDPFFLGDEVAILRRWLGHSAVVSSSFCSLRVRIANTRWGCA